MSILKTLFVQSNESKSKRVKFTNVDTNITVGDLKQKIEDKEGSGMTMGALYYSGKPMKDEKTLAFYEVKNKRTIFGTFRLRGGTEPIKFKEKDLQNLKVKLGNEDCVLNCYSSCTSSLTKRMKFPGCTEDTCWYCYKCIQLTIKNSISNKKSSVECPSKCGDFDFDTILLAAHFDEKTENDILHQLDINELEKSGIKACSQCKNFVTKPKDVPGNRVRCSNKKCLNSKQDFCWQCRKKWKNPSDNYKCGRDQCADSWSGYVIMRITGCETKDYEYRNEGLVKNIPVCRLCTNCHTFMEWGEDCRHLTCKKCDHGFCFSCLKRWKTCTCSYCRKNPTKESCSLEKGCLVAPRQSVENI